MFFDLSREELQIVTVTHVLLTASLIMCVNCCLQKHCKSAMALGLIFAQQWYLYFIGAFGTAALAYTVLMGGVYGQMYD